LLGNWETGWILFTLAALTWAGAATAKQMSIAAVANNPGDGASADCQAMQGLSCGANERGDSVEWQVQHVLTQEHKGPPQVRTIVYQVRTIVYQGLPAVGKVDQSFCCSP
jgi:hypothetical protein